MQRMRIAQISPLYESVPPSGYGGTERVVSWLTEALVAAGHELVLFASGDSQTKAELVPCAPRALRLDPSAPDPIAAHLVMLEEAFSRAHEFDVIHAHVDYLAFPFARRVRCPVVTTLHGRLDLPSLVPVFREYPEQRVISISDHQRRPLPDARWQATIHHGLPPDLYALPRRPRRLPRVPGPHLAREAGRPRHRDRRPRGPPAAHRRQDRRRRSRLLRARDPAALRPPAGGVRRRARATREKNDFLGNAAAVLFPIDWPEPFGLIMIEALACGTPVIAWPHGSVPEVLEDGVSGYLCTEIDEAVRAVERIGELDRRRCRAEFERRFTAERMARDYAAVYERFLA